MADPQRGFVGLQHVEARTERPFDPRAQDRVTHTRLALHVDAVEAAVGLERALRGRQIERAERDAPEVSAVAEAEEADDAELLRGAAQEHSDPVTHREAVLLRGADVHEHLARVPRRTAHTVVDQAERAVVHPGDAEGRWPTATDALAVMPDELRVAGDESLRPGHAGDRADGVERRLGDALGLAGVAERARAFHHEIDT